MKKTVCIVNAHPDDLIGSAGLAFMLAESGGYDLKIIDFSRGERGLSQHGVSMEECAAKRTQEELEACACSEYSLSFCMKLMEQSMLRSQPVRNWRRFSAKHSPAPFSRIGRWTVIPTT